MPENAATEYFVILVRHASREVRWGQRESEHGLLNRVQGYDYAVSSEKKGVPRTYELAGRLCDELDSMNITVTKIMCGEHRAARDTAKIYERVLRERGSPQVSRDSNVEWLTPRPDRTADVIKTKAKNAIKDMRTVEDDGALSQPGSACILVGHQPDLTEIARGLLGRRYLIFRALPSGQLPIGSSEAALLQFGENGRLRWILTEKPKELLDELKDKVKSEYDVAKFFLGAFVVNTGLLLNAGIWSTRGSQGGFTPADKVLVILAVIAAMASLALTAATLFSYDKLMMPEEFWSDNSRRSGTSTNGAKMASRWTISRPPSQAHVVLFYEMVHVWKVFFIPAIVSAFLAIGLLVIAFAHRAMLVPDTWSFGVAIFATFILVAAFYYWKRSRLGFED
jgi:phosphohistidine phosphatase SixA